MLNNPALNEIQDQVGCRYMLVTTVAKRARQLMHETERIGDEKPVSVAVSELVDGKLNIKFPEEYK